MTCISKPSQKIWWVDDKNNYGLINESQELITPNVLNQYTNPTDFFQRLVELEITIDLRKFDLYRNNETISEELKNSVLIP